MALTKLTELERKSLIYAIAHRTAKASELAGQYGCTTTDLKAFVSEWRLHIEREAAPPLPEPEEAPEASPEPRQRADTVNPQQLDDLWITKKFERLKRLQAIAEEQEYMINQGGMSAAELAMAVREFRSYLMLAANELGQLLHRGSGDAGTEDVLNVQIAGVDMDALR